MSKAITFIRPGVQPNGFIEEVYYDTDGAVDSNWTNISGGAGTFNSGTFSGVLVAYARRWNPAVIGGAPGSPKVIGGTVAAADIWGAVPSLAAQVVEATTSILLTNGANNNLASIGAYNFATIVGPTGAFSITGIAAGADGVPLSLYNSVAQAMTISNNSSSSAVGSRIITTTGADVLLPSIGTVDLIYNAAQNAWVVTGISQGASGTGTVTSVSGGITGLTVATATTTPTLGGTLAVANGGSGTSNGTSPTVVTSAASGAIAVPTANDTSVFITYNGGAGAYTLAAPTAGGPGTGQDGVILNVITTTAQAHVITSGVDGFNAKGSSGTATFTAAIGNTCKLVAYNGHWYAATKTGVTIA